MLDAAVPIAKVARIAGWSASTMARMAARYGQFEVEELHSAVECTTPRENPEIDSESPVSGETAEAFSLTI
jgi:hypothetical protein